MAQLKCTECGQVFDKTLDACPNCGCPASECEAVEEQQPKDNKQEKKQGKEQTFSRSKATRRDTGNGVIHDSYNEAEPYTPFSPTSWFSKDPWPLTNYPKGRLDVKHPLIGYICAPWHLTCKNESKRESYNILNNVFYFLNLIWKTSAYATVWAFFKGWKCALLLIGVILLQILITWGLIEMGGSGAVVLGIIVGIIFYILYIGFAIAFFILEMFGYGKALHRYWDDIYRTFMRLNKRYWISMRKSVDADVFDDID